MARLIFLFCINIFVLFFFEKMEAQVSIKEAETLARNFFSQKTFELNVHPKDDAIDRQFTKAENGQCFYHVFNFEQGGYVITSADRRFFPVLAWSPDGEFDFDSIPENCAEWLNWYEVQMKLGLEEVELLSGEMSGWWDHFLNLVSKEGSKSGAPLLTVKWNQGKFFNELCPADPNGSDGHTPVGCVATAMAQLMYYYRFPPHGAGSNSYIPPYNNGFYGMQFADFGNTFYQWDEMVDECLTYNTSVAELSYHCAVAVSMKFSPNSSGASVSDIGPALADYFNYLPNAQLLLRQSAGSYEIWRQTLTDHLDNNQPVIYFSSSGYVGHAYICDGYSDSTHFHFNWGWSGNYNGYYYINELIPGGIDLSQGQGGIFNIFPDTTLFNYPPFCTEAQVLHSSIGSIEDGSGALNYLPFASCSWLIKPDDPAITNIRLDFSMFDLTEGTDFLHVYNGETNTAPLIGSYTGKALPQVVISAQPAVLLEFESNDTITAKGFHANYHSFTLPFCHELSVITNPTGYLNDGSDFLNYTCNMDCNWRLAPEAQVYDSVEKMLIQFTKFQLAGGDTLFIYDGTDNTAPLLASLSGNELPPELESSGQHFFLNFRTNEADSASGWEIKHTGLPPDYCLDTTVIADPAGIIEDGSGSKHYNANSFCHWEIQIPGIEFITIEFTRVDMELNYDYVLIRDLNQPYLSPVKVTGTTIPAPFTILSNNVLITFYSDLLDNHFGWELKYHASAEQVSEQTNQSFTIYPNPVTDILVIRHMADQTGKLSFSIFDPQGNRILSGDEINNETKLDMKLFTKGIYLMEINIGNQSFYRKIVKL